jgi:hypothetical protein
VNTTRTGKQQRYYALLILLVVLLVAISLLAGPVWLMHEADNETIAYLENRLAALQEGSTPKAGLRTQLEALEKSQRSNSRYLKSRGASLGSAELQGILKRITDSNRVEILSTQTLPEVQVKSATLVTIKVRSRGALADVLKTFMAIERNRLALHLDVVSLRNRNANRHNQAPRTLDVDFNLVGIMRTLQ